VKIHDISDPTNVRRIVSKEMASGHLFDVQFTAEDPFIIATGGSGGQLAIWELLENKQVEKAFAHRI